MNTSVIWFRQIGSINLSRNSPTATGYDTHKYMVDRSQTVPSTASLVENPHTPLEPMFLRTIMIPLPDDTPSLFILVRAVKQPLLAPLFVTLARTFDRVEIICRGNAKRHEKKFYVS